MTAGDIIQPTSPKSPFASSSAFESVESSDDEDDMTDSSVIDITHRHTNGNAVSSRYKLKMFTSVILSVPISLSTLNITYKFCR